MTEKCVATGGGGVDEPLPQAFKNHTQQIEIKANRIFFMMLLPSSCLLS